MNYPQPTPKKSALKSIFGILLIVFSVTSICWSLVLIAKNTAQYDCYVWGFNHAVCRYGQAVANYPGYDRCPNHLKPISLCEGFPETKRGMSDALRFIKGESVESPPANRDYRTFHVNW